MPLRFRILLYTYTTDITSLKWLLDKRTRK